MARSRNIKPSFFSNEDLVELPYETRLLFIGLWTLADKAGRLQDRPKKIKMELFPGDNLNIDNLLDGLASRGFIARYEVEGQRYIQVTNFLKHQQPHHKERESELPGPEKSSGNNEKRMDGPSMAMHEPSMDQEQPKQVASCPTDSLNLIPDSLLSDSLNKGSTSADDSPERSDAVRSFPLKDKTQGHIDEAYVADLQTAYPKLDVENELRRARLWLVSNPAKGKTKAGLKKFLNGWMSRQGAHQKTSASVHQFPSRHVGLTDRDLTEGMEEQADGTYRF